MKDLIQITQTQIGADDCNSVNARDLHKTLEVKKDFSDWIKQQLMIGRKNSVYVEKIDYLINPLKGGRQIDYIITLDTAKRISMLSKTKKGDEVRRYFIDIEKQATKQKVPSRIINAIELSLEALKQHDRQFDKHHERLNNVENYIEEDLKSRPVSYMQQKALMDAKNKKVYELAPTDEKLQKGLHRKVWHLFKKQFNLPRYSELRAVKFDDGVSFIKNLQLSDMV